MPSPSAALAMAALPEVGQLVRVRDRHWVVTNLLRSSLASDPVVGALWGLAAAGMGLALAVDADSARGTQIP